MDDAVDLFIVYREAENLSRRTIRWYRDHLGVFLVWLPTDVEVADVRSVDVACFIAEQASDKREPRPLASYTVRARYRPYALFSIGLRNQMKSAIRRRRLATDGVKRSSRRAPVNRPKKFVPYDHYQRYVADIEPA